MDKIQPSEISQIFQFIFKTAIMKTNCQSIVFLLFIVLFTSCNQEEEAIPSPQSYLDKPSFITDGLVAYYPFNGNIADYSGNGIDAIALNPKYSEDRYNISGGSIHFNGVDDYVQIPGFGQLFVNNEGTLIIWSKNEPPYITSSNDPLPVILSLVDSVNACFMLFSFSHAVGCSFGTYPSLSASSEIDGANQGGFTLSVISFTDNGITAYYYSNGHYTTWSLSNQNNSFGFAETRNNQDLYLGKSPIDTFDSDPFDFFFTNFEGDIDDLLIYNRTLTQEEIISIFNLIEN